MATMKAFIRLTLPGLAAALSLFAGLVPTLLDHGRVQPLDWLIPGFVALAAMRFGAGGATRPGMAAVSMRWALVALPPLLVAWLAGSVMLWAGIATLALLLAVAALVLARSPRPLIAVLAGLMLFGGVRFAVHMIEAPVATTSPAGRVAVMTALPLFRQGEGASDVLHGVGVRAPVIRGLEEAWRPEPIDMLDGNTLRGRDRLLLVQPRLLAPAELVALDEWVRRGGHVAVLADPFLHWPDGRPLTDGRRPPITSLLDPLLSHWGLTLEPADLDPAQPVERRLLSGGAMIQLAGASRFTLTAGSACTLAERGLLAYCRIGKGRAVLIADADWIDDRLWTRAPEHLRDRRAWTSAALPMLTHILRGDDRSLHPAASWLISHDRLISALRWALGLLVLLAIGLARVAAVPRSGQARSHDPGPDLHPPPMDSA